MHLVTRVAIWIGLLLAILILPLLAGVGLSPVEFWIMVLVLLVWAFAFIRDMRRHMVKP